ncbi:amidohydrolase [Anaerosolibacter sp.]|uniref:amidohydrolase n=1 Tax=Anaerosolibacter sp. TaxID=1872527 RepID=UPI0039F02994
MDMILHNGRVVTMDSSQPEAEAVAIQGNKIIKVGSTAEIRQLKKDHTEMIDLGGKLLVPGFHDSHMHLLNYSLTLHQVDLRGVTSMGEFIQKGIDFLSSREKTAGFWLQGRGWNQDFFSEKTFPTRHDLDKITTEYPIVFARACGHVIVVNSKALAIAGVTKATSQLEGGHFDLDSEGEPLGIFRENALQLIYCHIPDPSLEEIKSMIIKGGHLALAQGITSVQSDDFQALPEKDFVKIIKAYESLRDNGMLPIRVYEQCLLPTIEKLQLFMSSGYQTGHGDEFFKLGPLKLLCDGSLGARTAYLRDPYTDDPATCGIPVYTQQELDQLVLTAHQGGMQLAIHCIGDGIMYMAFESIEKALNIQPKDDHRHGIIHCQITDKTLLYKFAELDVIAHIQPIFIDYDLHIVEQRIGKDRAQTSYNWHTMVDLGVAVACGSDCPVEPFDVLPGIYAAVTRKDLQGYPPQGWLPEQRLSVSQALYGFTMGAAYASFSEDIKGSISPGKLADMVVLSQDIFTIDPNVIKTTEVVMTILDGQIVYSA